MAITGKQVKFYRGLAATYFGTGAAPSGQDVAYKSDYQDGIFYATDEKVVYINGIRYGYKQVPGSHGDLNAVFNEVRYYEPNASTGAAGYFTLKQLDGTWQTVTLFKIQSSSNAIEVTYVPDSSAYKVGLKISDSDQVLTQENDGLKVNLILNYDKANKRISLQGKTKNNILQDFGSIDATDFVRDGMIKNVTVVRGTLDGNTFTPASQEGEGDHYLKIEWNADAGQGSDAGQDSSWYDDETVVNPLTTYVPLESFFNIYEAGNAGISISGYSISVVVNTGDYLSLTNAGITFDDASINSQFDAIRNTTINGHDIGDGDFDIDASEIDLGTVADLTSDTSDSLALGNDESVKSAIDKINERLNRINSYDAGLQTEVDNIEAAIGINNDGTIDGSVFDSANFTDSSSNTKPTTVVEAINNMDKNVMRAIQEMDYAGLTSNDGDFTINVTQTDGKISSQKGWVIEQNLHGYSGESFASDTSIGGAFKTVDETITWHEV